MGGSSIVGNRAVRCRPPTCLSRRLGYTRRYHRVQTSSQLHLSACLQVDGAGIHATGDTSTRTLARISSSQDTSHCTDPATVVACMTAVQQDSTSSTLSQAEVSTLTLMGASIVGNSAEDLSVRVAAP
jgi:hypothetical protein